MVQTYEDDNGQWAWRIESPPKISENHIYPNEMKKMKVSVAAQVFSHCMASIMTLLCRKGFSQDSNSIETALILKFFDTLFDSVNGSTRHINKGKRYKSVIPNYQVTYLTVTKPKMIC